MLPGLSSILTAIAALAAVLGFILLAARFVRTGPLVRSGNGPLAVRDVLPLDAGRRLHLVRCEGREFLLLTGGSVDIFLGWVPERDPGA